MKKLLCILMLGMIFGQTKVESRSYVISVSIGDDFNLESITGHSLDWYVIQVLGYENEQSSNWITFSDNGEYIFGYDSMQNGGIFSHIFSNLDYTINSSGEGIGTLTLLVTAEFPPDTSGDADGDGYDDVCYEAGAESGDINGDGVMNVLDMVVYVEIIINDF